MLGVGVVGYGYWGPNMARNLAEHPEIALVGLCDRREEPRALARRRFPTAKVTPDYGDLLADPRVDVIAICTPVASHYELARLALESGRHVLVEKPLTMNVDDAARLIDLAHRKDRLLMVDHTPLFNPAVRKIRDLVATGHLGSRVLYYDSVRVNLGLFQHDVNVLWDLAVHDLSVMLNVLGTQPLAVSATGVAHVPNRPENLAYLTCFFEGNLIAHLHANWLAPVKVRQTLIGGDEKMIVYNDLEPSEKLKIYDKGVRVSDDGTGGSAQPASRIDYRAGDMWAPKIPAQEALNLEVQEFADAILRGRPFPSDGRTGLQVVQILQAADQSMRNRGLPVEITPVALDL